MKAIRALAASIFILFVLDFACFGQEQKFANYNFAITPPDGWELRTDLRLTPGILAVFTKPGNTAQLAVTLDESRSAPVVMDDQFVNQYNEVEAEGGGGNVISGSFVSANGTRCYERVGEMERNGRKISTLLRAVPYRSAVFSLVGVRFDGDVNQLPELRKSFDTFRFLNPPSQAAGSLAAVAGTWMPSSSTFTTNVAPPARQDSGKARVNVLVIFLAAAGAVFLAGWIIVKKKTTSGK